MKKLIVLLVLLVILISCIFYQQNSKFTIEKWNGDVWNREKLISDLTKRYNLYEMNEDGIMKLLGSKGLVENSHYTYYIGKSYVGAILFNISFDNNGFVKDYGVIVD